MSLTYYKSLRNDVKVIQSLTYSLNIKVCMVRIAAPFYQQENNSYILYLYLQMIWALIMLFSGGLTTFMEFIQLFSLIMSIFVIVALLYLRWIDPLRHRPYKVLI